MCTVGGVSPTGARIAGAGVLLATLVAALLLARCPAGASAAAKLPPQGVYEQCPPGAHPARCAANLRRVARVGIKYVLNYQALNGSPRQIRAYARAARNAGVKLIWPLIHPAWRGAVSLRRTYPQLSRGCHCTNLLRYTVRLLRHNPATWGWYVGDELPASTAPAVIRLADRVLFLDPNHPRLYMQAGLDQLFGAGLKPFAPAAEYLGNDMFPFGTAFATSILAQSMGSAGREASALRRKFVATLQAFAWNQVRDAPPTGIVDRNHFPTYAEMLKARNLTLKVSRPVMILWYSLQDIDHSRAPARHFADWARAVRAPAPR
ncbi:hypothetical protein DSM104329_05263 [Capillimicrobium parvum]|uniref:Uncharacterized protein n=1 Tax=Capillimicrobium parvum TaxID=2884022 RepID=A0A9E7C6H6_9ACTN|nr:hypothetical protein DSM104329_05263 [Capillimicrobium parvum]